MFDLVYTVDWILLVLNIKVYFPSCPYTSVLYLVNSKISSQNSKSWKIKKRFSINGPNIEKNMLNLVKQKCPELIFGMFDPGVKEC